jgi:hypothetical protein
VRAEALTTAPASDVTVPPTRKENIADASVEGKSALETKLNESCTSEPTTSLCADGTLDETDPAAVGTHCGAMKLPKIVRVISGPTAPSGARKATWSTTSVSAAGATEPRVTVAAELEHEIVDADTVVSALACMYLTYATCDATTLEWRPSPPANVSVSARGVSWCSHPETSNELGNV